MDKQAMSDVCDHFVKIYIKISLNFSTTYITELQVTKV